VVLVDFCKVFESITQESIFAIIKAYGIPDQLFSQ